MRKIVCDPLKSQELFVIIRSPSYKSFLCFDFVPNLLCRGDCVWERSCVLPVLSCNSSVEVPLWKVLCRHSRNPSVWGRGHRAVAQTSIHILLFAFESFSLNSHLFISCIILLAYIHMLDIVCVLTLVVNQAIKAPQLIIQRNRDEQFQSPSREIQTHSWLHIMC